MTIVFDVEALRVIHFQELATRLLQQTCGSLLTGPKSPGLRHKQGVPRDNLPGTRLRNERQGVTLRSGAMAFATNQRVRVNLAGLMIQGVTFHAAVTDAIATVMKKISDEPSVYMVDLMFSFKGLKQIEVPEDRIRPA
jgi:hypothetical protein